MAELPQRIRGFDGLRALAFLMVFVSHKTALDATARYGTAGVWLFFVLSGFLITRILARSRLDIEAGGRGYRAALGDFYLRRTLRIFPIYYTFLIVVTALSLLGLIDLGAVWRQVSNWLFLTNFYVEFRGWETDLGHLWSLAVEEQFYLLFAPLALLVPHRRLAWLCGALLALSVAAHGALIMRGAADVIFDANSLLNFGLLALGGLAGLACDRPLPRRLPGDVAIVASLAIFLLAPLFVSNAVWLQFGRLGGVFVALALILIHQNQGGRLVRLLDWAPLRGLGLISYGAYLFHPVIKVEALLAAMGHGGRGAHAVGAGLDLILTVVLATASWRFLETPVRNLARRAPPAAVPAAAAV